MLDGRLTVLQNRGLALPPPIVTCDSWFGDSTLMTHVRQQQGAFGDSDVPQVTPLYSAGEHHFILRHEESPMGAAEVIAFEEVRASKQWDTLRHQLHACFDQWLDTLETQWHEPPSTLPEVTATVWALRQQLTGGITETIVTQAHTGECQRTRARCPKCPRVLKVQEHVWRTVETMVGPVELERPY